MARLPDENVISEVYDPNKDYPDPTPGDESEYRRKKAQQDTGGDDGAGGGATGPSTPQAPGNLYATGKWGQTGTGQKTAAFLDRFLPVRQENRFSITCTDFRYGIITSLARGTRPYGSMQDMQNLLIDRENGALTQRHGHTAYIAGSVADIGDTNTLSVFYAFRQLTQDVPNADTTIDILAGQDEFAESLVFQKPFYHNSTTKTSDWVKWGETESPSISGAPSGATLVIDSGSDVDNYYNGWVVYNTNKGEYALVTDYDQASKTLTVNETVETIWEDEDSLRLSRHFHDNPAFALDVTGSNISILQQGDAILFCGGRGTATGNKPVWSGYLNKSFFQNSTPVTYTGTYVTEAEIKSNAGFVVGDAATWGAAPSVLDATKNWFVGFVLETDDGQRSAPIFGSTRNVDAPAGGITATLKFYMGALNKRIRRVNVFMGYVDDHNATTIPWDQLFFVKQYDIVLDPDSEFSHQATVTSPDAIGYHYVAVNLDNTDWDGREANGIGGKEESLLENLGVDAEFSTSIVSFNYGVFINNRLFVADYYDYGEAKNYQDQIRYSGFNGSGVPMVNVLPDIDHYQQSTIGSNDQSNIRNLVSYQGNLFVIKDNSCYVIAVTADSTGWQLEKIADIGTDISKSVVSTPFGVCWYKTSDDIYIWSGGFPKSIANNTIRATFLSIAGYLTGGSGAIAWYDPIMRAYMFQYSPSEDVYQQFAVHFDIPIFGNYAWTKHQIAWIISPTINYQNSLMFVVGGTGGGNPQNIWKSAVSALDDAGTDIAPYFDTGDYTIDERDIGAVQEFHLALNQDSSATWGNTLDIQVHVDGSAVGSYTGITKTKNFLKSVLPLTAIGRRVRFKYNTNATKATYSKSSATAQELTFYELGIRGVVRPLLGDASHSL